MSNTCTLSGLAMIVAQRLTLGLTFDECLLLLRLNLAHDSKHDQRHFLVRLRHHVIR